MAARYKHTFEIYINLESGDEHASDVTAEMLVNAFQKRIDALKQLMTDSELIEEIGLIDTYEVQPREVTK